MELLTQFAAENASQENVFSALGIDWKMLIFQIIGFVILVWLLSKYVYPVLIKTVDARQAEFEASSKAAQEAEKKAEETKAEVEKLLHQARRQAADIVTTAKEEATAAIEAADSKAKARADHIVADAHEQIAKDVVAARKALHNDTIELVAAATEKVLGKTVTPKVDDSLIASAIKEAK